MLFAIYKVPGAGVKDFVPSTLFPDYRPKVGPREDPKQEIVIEFDYSTPGRPPIHALAPLEGLESQLPRPQECHPA